jgi:hypothetical protein
MFSLLFFFGLSRYMARKFTEEERAKALATRRENKRLKEEREKEMEARQKSLEESVAFLKQHLEQIGQQKEDDDTVQSMEILSDSEPEVIVKKRRHKKPPRVVYISDSEDEPQLQKNPTASVGASVPTPPAESYVW